MSNDHLNPDQLTLWYYGEDAGAAVEEHLDGCEQCRQQYRSLQRVLNAVSGYAAPERGPEYGAAVWSRIEHGVRKRRWRWSTWWVMAPAMAGLMVAAFVAGWLTRPVAPAGKNMAANNAVRERVLLVAVGDHLERSQMVLAEISNAAPGKGGIDISAEQESAADLLDSNRLFRQTANTTGDHATANVLDDLERVLIEISNGPSHLTPQQATELRNEIRERGLLFKIRVFGSQVRQREDRPLPKTGGHAEGTDL